MFGQGIAKVEYEEFDASDMHENPEKAAEFGMPDNGQGEKQVFRIVDSEREEVAEGFKLNKKKNRDKKKSEKFFQKIGVFSIPQNVISFLIPTKRLRAGLRAMYTTGWEIQLGLPLKLLAPCRPEFWMTNFSQETQLKFVSKKEKSPGRVL